MTAADPIRPLWRSAVQKLMTARGVAMTIAALVVVAGIAAVFLEVQGEGLVDIKSAFVTGQIRTGHIGLALLFVGIVLVGLILALPVTAKHRIEVRASGRTITYTGRLSKEAYQDLLGLLRQLEAPPAAPSQEPDSKQRLP